MTEERKEREVALKIPQSRAESFLETLAETEPSVTIVSIEVEGLQRWSGIVLADDVPEAFWQEVLRSTEYWLERVKGDIEGRNIPEAMRLTRLLLKSLANYAELLGLEIPPEEEEPPAAEEVQQGAVVEGMPLVGLGLSNRVYNSLSRSRVLAEALGTMDPEDLERRIRRPPYVEEVLRILEVRGEDFLLGIGSFGPLALEELKEKLRGKGFEEPWKRELMKLWSESQ